MNYFNRMITFSLGVKHCGAFLLRSGWVLTPKHHRFSSKILTAENLTNRKVLRISGESSSDFLQGLITNDMRNLQNDLGSIYALFLNNKGRILFDTMIYRTNNSHTYLLDCDSEVMDQLVRHLKLYKVRRKIDILPVDSEYSVWAIYDPSYIEYLHCPEGTKEVCSAPEEDLRTLSEDNIVVPDPRVSALGYRALIKDQNFLNQFQRDNQYTLCRYKLGIGEGPEEFQIGQSFPLEMNCDYLNGVSFDKGCYIGQELTARTHHTGVVRKRLLPFQFDTKPQESIPFNTSVDEPEITNKSIGKFKGSCQNYGLALMRVSETIESKYLKILSNVARAYVPHWWPLDFVQQKYLKPRMV